MPANSSRKIEPHAPPDVFLAEGREWRIRPHRKGNRKCTYLDYKWNITTTFKGWGGASSNCKIHSSWEGGCAPFQEIQGPEMMWWNEADRSLCNLWCLRDLEGPNRSSRPSTRPTNHPEKDSKFPSYSPGVGILYRLARSGFLGCTWIGQNTRAGFRNSMGWVISHESWYQSTFQND